MSARERKHYTDNIVPGQAPGGKGLRCSNCGGGHFRVVYTRAAPFGGVRRRRACRHCGARITTIERATDGKAE